MSIPDIAERCIRRQLSDGTYAFHFNVEWQGRTVFCLRVMQSRLVEEIALCCDESEASAALVAFNGDRKANRQRLILLPGVTHPDAPRMGISELHIGNHGAALIHRRRPLKVSDKRWSSKQLP